MLKILIDKFKNFEKITYKIMTYGLEFCFSLCMISVIILITYNFIFTSPILFYIGLSLFKLSLTFCIEFIICALVVDSIKKHAI